MSAFKFHRPMAQLGVALLCAALGFAAEAVPLPLRTIDFGDGLTAVGVVTTDDVSGAIVGWRVAVRSTTRLAHFSRANTPALGLDQVAVSADGSRLTVATSPDPLNVDGGQLSMRSANPSLDFGAVLADFSGANASGGQATYMVGAAFDFLALGAAPGVDYTVATASAANARLFNLNPLSFADGVTLSGTLLTDGSSGALGVANLLAWDIFVDQVIEDVFDPSNSVLDAAQLAFDPSLGALVLDNPDGRLAFNKAPLGGRLHAVVLADFSDPQWPQGKAAYYQGRLSSTERSLAAGPGPWRVTGTDTVTVPEPGALGMSLLALALGGALARRHAGQVNSG